MFDANNTSFPWYAVWNHLKLWFSHEAQQKRRDQRQSLRVAAGVDTALRAKMIAKAILKLSPILKSLEPNHYRAELEAELERQIGNMARRN